MDYPDSQSASCYFYYSNVSLCKVVQGKFSWDVGRFPAPLCTMVSAQTSGLAVDDVCNEAIEKDNYPGNLHAAFPSGF